MAKSANLLVDGLGGPERIGLLLPLHWQAVALLLAGVTTTATVVLATDPEELAGCGAAFVLAADAEAALDAGVDEVFVLSDHPLGAPAGPLPAMAQDYAREVPSYADHFGGSRAVTAQIEVAGQPVAPAPGLVPSDRLLTTLGLVDGAGVLLGALAAGAGLVLLRSGDAVKVAADERVTVTAGVDVPGLMRQA